MRFVYATDLHGNRDAIEQLFTLAHKEQVDAIVFGGDLTPKSVAIKLARYPDPSKEDTGKEVETSFVGGGILPADILKKDVMQSTFSRSLQNIKLLNEKFGADAFEEHLERKGSIIIEQTNQYYQLDSMLAEQVLLDKLISFLVEKITGHSDFSVEETTTDDRIDYLILAPKEMMGMIIGKGGKFGVIKLSGTLKEPRYDFKTAVGSIIQGLANMLFKK